jgi:hypothetical protein
VIVIVVVVIPVVIRAPPVPVFIPPFVFPAPAAFALFRKLMTPVIGLLAVWTMVLDGFVQLVVDSGGLALAIVIRADLRDGENKHSRQCREANGRLARKTDL